MELKIKGVDFIIDDSTNDMIKSKLAKLDFAQKYITYLNFTIKKTAQIKVEADVHFNWGNDATVSHEGFNVDSLIDDVINSLDAKVRKEKEKHIDKKN